MLVLVVDFFRELEAVRHSSELVSFYLVECRAVGFVWVLEEMVVLKPYSFDGVNFEFVAHAVGFVES